MAHTIEEMLKAKQRLCEEIADKLLAFEEEYGARISGTNYESKYLYINPDRPAWAESEFKIRIEL